MARLAQSTLALCLAGALAACANAASETDTVKTEVSKKFPQQTVASVRTTPIKGLYEVVFAPKQVIYTDAKANYILVGDLVDVTKRQSLTEARVRELSKTDFAKLPLDQAIKQVRGNGQRKVVVFSDPDCPFCKKLERDTIQKLDNVTVYTFLYPLAQLHPDAHRKSGLIWCAADRQKAWDAWMLEGKLPEGKSDCATPLEQLALLAEKLDIRATPTMVFESGEIVPGAIDKDAFEAKLAGK